MKRFLIIMVVMFVACPSVCRAEWSFNDFTDEEKEKLAGIESGAEVNEPLVSQLDAEAGTSETEYSWSPLRIAQAIAALASSASSFLGLSDTPSSYTGQGGKSVTVKSDETGLEFTSGGGSMVYPGAGIPISTGIAWGTSITNNSDSWNAVYNWYVTFDPFETSDETDPDFAAWLLATPPIYTETDPTVDLTKIQGLVTNDFHNLGGTDATGPTYSFGTGISGAGNHIVNTLPERDTGTNTGDETAATIEDIMTAADAVTTPADADTLSIVVSAVLKKVTWTNIKATLKTYFDGIYSPIIADPNTDKIRLWDDTDGAEVYVTVGDGLSYTHATHTLSAEGTSLNYGSKTIIDPDGVQLNIDAVTLMTIETESFPYGITIIDCGIKTSASSTYTVVFESWSAPGTHSADIETVATSSSLEAEDDGTIDSPTIGADYILKADLPTTAENELVVWWTYTINAAP